MGRVRILVVDDAVVVRRMLTSLLSSDPDLEVVGTAANGRIAMDQFAALKPDLVLLDVEMPEMDGLATLGAIRARDLQLPVLMFSSLTERGAKVTLEALARGASDYVTKPESTGGPAAAIRCLRGELIPKIKLWCGTRAARERRSVPGPIAARAHGADVTRVEELPATERLRSLPVAGRRGARDRRVEIIAIGVSTGGPNALMELLPRLAADLPVPIVIVQHMPPVFTKLLAQRLDVRSALRIEEGAEGVVLLPGGGWVAPGDYHTTVRMHGGRVYLALNKDPHENSCRPAVDVLLRSVAKTYGSGALAVVMTGMGRDGLRGCERIREAGGTVLVQDEATSVVWGMPGLVAKANLADAVLPLGELAAEITRVARLGTPRPAGTQAIAPTL